MVIILIGGIITGTCFGIIHAYFNDIEMATDNSLTAATLDLTVDGDDIAVTTFNLSSVSPGDSGFASTIISNIGSIDGELDVSMGNVDNIGGGDTTEYEDSIGNLGVNAEIAIFIDKEGDGSFGSPGEKGLKWDGTKYNHNSSLDFTPVEYYGNTNWDDVHILETEDTWYITISWIIPESVGNSIQGDSVKFDLALILEQPTAD